MSNFEAPIPYWFEKNSCHLTPITGTREWTHYTDFSFHADSKLFIIPAGTVTDLSSTPRVLWGLYPKAGKYVEAGAIHDYLYRNGLLTRKGCDEAYYQFMLYCGVSKLRAKGAYAALRVFGASNYKGSK